MLYFIPAWDIQKWKEQEQHWYRRRLKTEFDDSVKHIQLFHRNSICPYNIILLHHAPNFRHFLHRQSVYHAPYYSCFDFIQEINDKQMDVFSFHDLKWPNNIEFIYSPFCVIAFLDGKKYAQVQFGEDGNMIEVEMFKNEIICRKNIYDDRGFISSTIVYENGKPSYERYLMKNGTWKISHSYTDDHVDINPKSNHYTIYYENESIQYTYKKLRYEHLEDVIEEVFQTFVEKTNNNDIFYLAMNETYGQILTNVLNNRKTILSFFQNRITKIDSIHSLIKNANYIITDSDYNKQMILQSYKKELPYIVEMTPYNTMVDFGHSLHLSIQNVLFSIDGMDDETFKKCILQFVDYAKENKRLRVHVFTRNAKYNIKDILLEKIQTILEMNNYDISLASKDNEQNKNDIDQNDLSTLFYVDQCIDELSVSKCLKSQRLMIDLTKHPDLFLQIACISAGIPQIMNVESRYVHHLGNGYIIEKEEELNKSLDYYLNGLKHWNDAKVYAYELGKEYTTTRLIEKWKEVIDAIQ